MTVPAGAPFTVDRVENAVVQCLNAIVSAAASFTPAIALPGRQIAGEGIIPYDCEQVFASVMTLGTGTPEPARGTSSSGVGTWPPIGNGANYTFFSATIQLAVVRNTLEKMTGLGQQAPTPAAYLGNLGLVSKDIALLWAAIVQIQDAEVTAAPTRQTAGNPQGGLVATSAQITILI